MAISSQRIGGSFARSKGSSESSRRAEHGGGFVRGRRPDGEAVGRRRVDHAGGAGPFRPRRWCAGSRGAARPRPGCAPARRRRARLRAGWRSACCRSAGRGRAGRGTTCAAGRRRAAAPVARRAAPARSGAPTGRPAARAAATRAARAPRVGASKTSLSGSSTPARARSRARRRVASREWPPSAEEVVVHPDPHPAEQAAPHLGDQLLDRIARRLVGRRRRWRPRFRAAGSARRRGRPCRCGLSGSAGRITKALGTM